MKFGEFVNQRRHALHYSSTDLGERAGCSASFITGIERGAQTPSTAMATNILFALDVEYEELDPLTIRASGHIFEFKASVRGRNREAIVSMEPGLTNEQVIRIEALTAAVRAHDDSQDDIYHKQYKILATADIFAEYITTGSKGEQ